MAKRRTLNRKRSSVRRSFEFIDTGLLDPDTNIVDEEQTFWWGNLQDNTFAPHSLIYNANETAGQLSANSRMDSSQSPPEWWKNLKHSDSEPTASTSSRRNLSAAIVKTNILQTSETSESEKEIDLRKRKVRLKANNRKSINNAFSNALDDTKVSKPSKLQKKQANYSDVHNESNLRKKGTHKSTILSTEMETVDDGDVDPGMQTIQRNSISTQIETGSKTANRPSVQSSNRTSVKEGREIASRQKSLGKSQNYRDTPTKASSRNISFNASKPNSSKTLRKIDDFFKVKQTSITTDKRSNEHAKESRIFGTENMEKIKTELERIKNREMAAMKIRVTDKKESALKAKNVKSITLKQTTKKKPLAKPTKVVDKAFLVDGKVYKAPRLPRPKHWATDRLYKFLWNRMEPKYKLATRLKSEKFMQELAKIVSFIEHRKHYNNYKTEMEILMREMARLKIINTRDDFYHFCQDFLPYEFRIKVVPMLLPGNKMNIPYDPEKLHTPLLDTID